MMDNNIFLFVALVLFTAQFCNKMGCHGQPLLPKFPAILVFGDSTVDAGNNNYITTIIKGDHPPYGKDYPGHVPTGRFSNGKLVPDILVSMVGLKDAIPPYLQPKLSDADIRTGVSFASAGSGYDDVTTLPFNTIRFSRQLELFKAYIQMLVAVAGQDEAKTILNNALIIVSASTNDFILSYYNSPARSIQFNITGYQDFLQEKMQSFIKELYDLGCRKMIIAGVAPIGCLPIEVVVKNPIQRTCISQENEDAKVYNSKLKILLPKLEAALPGSKIRYLDIYTPIMDMIANPQKFGFVETSKGCCGFGRLEVGPFCSPITEVCTNSSQYLFFDGIHPSEPAYKFIAENSVNLLRSLT